MECIENIVGLTDKDYDCATKAEDYAEKNISLTGYYVRDVEFTPDLNDRPDVYELLQESRAEAIVDTLTKIRAKLASYNNLSMNGLRDIAGRFDKANYAMSSTNNVYAGMHIDSLIAHKGLSMRINQLGLFFDKVGTYVLKLVNIDDPGTVIKQQQITTIANKKTFFNVSDWVLPFYGQSGAIRYALYYERNGERAYNSNFWCGCVDDNTWHRKRYLAMAGTNFDQLEQLRINNIPYNASSNGISIDFTLECDPLSWLCSQNTTAWRTNHLLLMISKVVVFYSNLKIISKLLNTNDPTVHTILDKEALVYKIGKLNKLIDESTDWIAEECTNNEFILNQTDCIQCKPQKGYKLENRYL